MSVPSGKLRQWVDNERGSLTLEASMVFPWVLILTFLLLLFTLVVADRVLLYYSASVTGERASFSWAHYSSDLRTGAYPRGRYDDLYWRLGDDALLMGLFGGGAASGTGETRVTVEPGAGGNGSASAAGKLGRAGGSLPAGTGGTLAYLNRLWTREITIDASGGKVPDPLRRFRPDGESRAAASVSALVTEPAEMIRSFELVRYYQAKLKSKGDGASDYRSRAAAVLQGKR